MLRLQGEQIYKLRELEDKLLSKISAVQGAILDDDTVINTLEKIKSEAAELGQEVAKTQEIMNEVRAVSAGYETLARAMASVYFSMERLADVSFLYQHSLDFFLDIVEKVLAAAPLSSSSSFNSSEPRKPVEAKEASVRLAALSTRFFNEVSRRVLRGLKFDDKLLFLVRLGQVAAQGQSNKELSDAEADLLFRGANPLLMGSNATTTLAKFKQAIPGVTLDDAEAKNLLSLNTLPAFAGLAASMANQAERDAWMAVMTGSEPEKSVPLTWSAERLSPERAALLTVMIIRALRPERTLPALEGYISAAFGQDLEWREHCKLDLGQMVERDSKAANPVMICSEAGQDASGKVDALASSLGRSLLQISMGSAEGFLDADRSIAQALKTGSWVLLRNVHLCPEWLAGLEKRLHSYTFHSEFRLFLTCDISPRLPSALLRASDVIVAEASTGIKANIQRFYNSIPSARIDKAPAERGRL